MMAVARLWSVGVRGSHAAATADPLLLVQYTTRWGLLDHVLAQPHELAELARSE